MSTERSADAAGEAAEPGRSASRLALASRTLGLFIRRFSDESPGGIAGERRDHLTFGLCGTPITLSMAVRAVAWARLGAQRGPAVVRCSKFGSSAFCVAWSYCPKRWVVERTHAWNERWRRMVMHHDRKTSVCTAWVWLAEARILLSRLATAR